MKRRKSRLLDFGALALGVLGAGVLPCSAVEEKIPEKPRPPALSDYQGKQPVVLLFMRGFAGEFVGGPDRGCLLSGLHRNIQLFLTCGLFHGAHEDPGSSGTGCAVALRPR